MGTDVHADLPLSMQDKMLGKKTSEFQNEQHYSQLSPAN